MRPIEQCANSVIAPGALSNFYFRAEALSPAFVLASGKRQQLQLVEETRTATSTGDRNTAHQVIRSLLDRRAACSAADTIDMLDFAPCLRTH